jgi:heavy metal sensor kinase
MTAVRLSILQRLTLWNSSVLALTLIAFAGAGWFTFQRVVQQRASAVVRESARAVAGAILAERRAAAARGDVEEVRGAYEQAVLRELRVGDLDIFITDESEDLMAVRQPRPEERPAIVVPPEVRNLMTAVRSDRVAGRLSDSTVVVRSLSLSGEPARAAVLRVEPDAGDEEKEPALLITALRMERDDLLLLRQVRNTIFFAIPMALVVSLVAGFLLARRSLAPLEAIVMRTASITAADLDERLPVINPHDELGRLARIINELLGRVGDAFRTQRQFVADASHELRTPLAIIRGEADLALRRDSRPEIEYRDALAVVQGEAVRLSRIVDDLFLLARVDAGASALSRQPVPLDQLMAEAMRSVRSLADTQQVTVVAYDIGDAVVHGDPVLLHRLLLNLLDNALKHSPVGGTVSLSLATDDARAMAHLQIRDEGPGVPEEQRARVFERFVHGVQSAPSRNSNGAGLGLAIAQAVAMAHGGRIRVLDHTPGATFDVALPLSPSAGVSA